MHNLQGRTGLRTRLLACGALGALVTAAALALPAQADTTAPAAAAQDQTATTTASTPAASDTVVVVHGFRYSLQSAQNLKRKNDDVVDAIAAEDIGKLPDASIADAIVRLPGLAAQRNNSGRTQDISIDGLPSAMNITLLNGFMQATTDNNRTTQFDQYPAEIMNSVVVYKIGDASLTGGAIGTIDMQTVRPLDYGKTALFVTAQGEYDTQGKLQPDAKDSGYRGSLTYITKLDDGKLGVMFGYAHITTPNQIISEHPYGYYAADDELEGGIQDEIRSDLLTRDSGILTLQYRPTDNLEFVTHFLDSSYDDNAIIRGVEFQPSVGTQTSISDGVSSWNNLQPQLESYDYSEKARLRSADITMIYKFGNNWKLHGDYGYSDANDTFDELQLYSGFGLNGQQTTSTGTLTEGAGPGGTIGISNWSANLQNVALGENLGWSNYIPANFPGACPGGVVSPNNPPSWGSTCNGGSDPDQLGGAGQNLIQHTYDSIQQTKWSLTKQMAGPISSVEFGVAASIRKKNYNVIEDELYLLNGNESTPIPANLTTSPTNLSVFGLPSMVSIDPEAAYNSGLYGSVADERAPGGGNGSALVNWWVSERVITPYVEAKVDTTLAGQPLTGNFGLQAVDTSQRVTTSSLTNPNNSTIFIYSTTPTSTDYWEFLPSLNLTWHQSDNQDFRFGADRSLARARFDQLGGASSSSYAVNNTNTAATSSQFSGSIANPTLKPWISDNVEFTYERYFEPGDSLQIEAFFKHLESYIYQSESEANFEGFYNATGPYTGLPPTTFEGPVTEYVNGHGGDLYGLELTGNYQLKNLWSVLDGFGVSATGSITESTVHIPAAPGCALNNVNTYQTPCQSGTPDGQLPQYSKYVANLTLYYEKNGFSFRINDRYRSKYDQEVPDFNGGLQPILGASENFVDAQASYDVTSGPLKNVTFTLSAQNITNTPMNSYTGAFDVATNTVTPATPKDTVYWKRFGTNILFGVRYKY